VAVQFIASVLHQYGQGNTLDGIGRSTFKDDRTKEQADLGYVREFKDEEDLETALSMFADSFAGYVSRWRTFWELFCSQPRCCSDSSRLLSVLSLVVLVSLRFGAFLILCFVYLNLSVC
jgi:hypothetical protein